MSGLSAPIEARAEITSACNLRCLHCYNDSSHPADEELTASEWCGVIDQLVAMRVPDILFEGGEPLTRPDFMDLLRHAYGRMGLSPLEIRDTMVTLIRHRLERASPPIKLDALAFPFLVEPGFRWTEENLPLVATVECAEGMAILYDGRVTPCTAIRDMVAGHVRQSKLADTFPPLLSIKPFVIWSWMRLVLPAATIGDAGGAADVSLCASMVI